MSRRSTAAPADGQDRENTGSARVACIRENSASAIAYWRSTRGHGGIPAQKAKNQRIQAFPADSRAFSSSVSRAISSDEHTSELQALMRISCAVSCWKTEKHNTSIHHQIAYS